MRAQDIIRAVLDILDKAEEQQPAISGEIEISNVDEPSRFKQILALLTDKTEILPTANTPNEKYADIDAVTTLAGGGLNGPKHPADIRVKDPRGFE